MSTRVLDYLEEKGYLDKVIEFDHTSTATVALAAEALGCQERDIAKSMAFVTPDPIIVVVAGDVKIDNSKYKHTFGVKAKMVAHDDLEELIGHLPGGVCPFNPKENVKVYLDESLKKLEVCYPACGKPNNAIRLTLEELEELTDYVGWVDVTKEVTA